jgi:DNA-binding PadR family transcriptional regulator
MSLRYAVLAVLLDGEASAYDLTRRFDRSVANFWHATRQQLALELRRLEVAELVCGRSVTEEGREKRLYRVTPAGEAAVREWLAEPARASAIKDEMLVRVQAAAASDADALLPTLRAWRIDRQARLDGYLRLRERLLAGRSEADYLATVSRPGGYLTLERGIALERENVAWAERVEAVLQRRLAIAE